MHSAKTKSMISASSAEQAYNERSMPSAEELSTTLNPSVGPNQITVDIRREFHNEETSTYWLPKDEDEQKRLTGQHFALKELFGGNMLSSVSDALDFEKGVSVLDIGCGSGVWIMDMINDYPNSTYHGCDIVDVINKSMKLDQFTFNHGNVAKGLPYADNTFDFVHMRLLVYALRKDEWPVAIKEAIRVVKPGGILQLVEGEPRLPKDNSCAYYKFTEAINNVGYMRGQNPRVILEIEELVAANDNIKVLQSDARCSDMSANTNNSKKFAWDLLQAAKSALPAIGPSMGINNREDALKFLEEYKLCLSTTECYICFKAVASKKLR